MATDTHPTAMAVSRRVINLVTSAILLLLHIGPSVRASEHVAEGHRATMYYLRKLGRDPLTG